MPQISHPQNGNKMRGKEKRSLAHCNLCCCSVVSDNPMACITMEGWTDILYNVSRVLVQELLGPLGARLLSSLWLPSPPRMEHRLLRAAPLQGH